MSKISAADRDNIDISLIQAIDSLFIVCKDNEIKPRKFKKVFEAIQQGRTKVEELYKK